MAAAAAMALTGCDTEVESIGIDLPSIEEQNPELYAQYLSDLRAYKAAAGHKVTLAWMDNSSDAFYNQSDHLTAMPDSIDYAVLMHPAGLTQDIQDEMAMVREKKGTQVLYNIDYAAIKESYAGRDGDFNAWLSDTVALALALCEKYAYDGVVVAFDGHGRENIDEQQAQAYADLEDAMLGPVKSWLSSHGGKTFVLQGYPEVIYDKDVVNAARFIVIPCTGEWGVESIAYKLLHQATFGSENAQYIPLVETVPLNPDETGGYFKDGTRAIIATAQWIAGYSGAARVAGLGICNAQRDYFNSQRVYPNVRQAIGIMNPTTKH